MRGAPGPAAILIGPEGGFDSDERAAIRATPGAVGISLGPRILRADTAAAAAVSLWMGANGDCTGRCSPDAGRGDGWPHAMPLVAALPATFIGASTRLCPRHDLKQRGAQFSRCWPGRRGRPTRYRSWPPLSPTLSPLRGEGEKVPIPLRSEREARSSAPCGCRPAGRWEQRRRRALLRRVISPVQHGKGHPPRNLAIALAQQFLGKIEPRRGRGREAPDDLGHAQHRRIRHAFAGLGEALEPGDQRQRRLTVERDRAFDRGARRGQPRRTVRCRPADRQIGQRHALPRHRRDIVRRQRKRAFGMGQAFAGMAATT
eukprot:gene7306-9858_t